MRKLLALALLIGVAFTGPVFADEDWDAGVAAYKAKNYKVAADAFARYVEKVETAYQGHQLLGVSLLKSGQAAKAATHLSRANELEPNNVDIQLPLGQALLEAGKARDACGVLGRINATSLKEANKTSLYQMRASANCGGSGIDDLKKVAQAKNDGETWAAYGVAALNENNMTEAISALDKAASLSPNDSKIRKSHVSALVRHARSSKGATKDATYAKALPSAKRYAELDSSYSAQLTYGEVLLGAKRYEEATTALKSASSKSPNEWLPNFYLGQAYTSLDSFDAAEAPLRKALSQASKADDVRMINRQLGFTYEKQKKFGEAIQFYEKAGDASGVARVRENERIARENADADSFNDQIKKLEVEREKLRREMEKVPTGGPPPRS